MRNYAKKSNLSLYHVFKKTEDKIWNVRNNWIKKKLTQGNHVTQQTLHIYTVHITNDSKIKNKLKKNKKRNDKNETMDVFLAVFCCQSIVLNSFFFY